jgi:hypothetical protein
MRAPALAVGLTLLGALMVSCSSGTAARSTAGSGKPDGASPSALQLTPVQRRALADRYLAIANPANVRLDAAVDGFREHQRRDLSAAVADLKEQAAVERTFDRHLLEIDFPVQVEMVAVTLVRANEDRADLAVEAATSPTLPALASLAPVRSASDARVEEQVNIIRRQLGLPPADKG